MRLTVGSCCSGIGGMDLGLERAGWEIRWQVEIDEWCRRVLAKHWPDVPKYADMKALTGEELEPVDLLAGGIPCQPHSLAGKRAGSSDERNLWPDFYRLVLALRPRFALVENVPGLLNSDRGRFYAGMVADLEAAGYSVSPYKISAADCGAPHRRLRLFIVAHRDSERQPQQAGPITNQWGRLGNGGDALAHAEGERRELRAAEGERPRGLAGGNEPVGNAALSDGVHLRGERRHLQWERRGDSRNAAETGEPLGNAANLGHERSGITRGWRDGPADADSAVGNSFESRLEGRGELGEPQAGRRASPTLRHDASRSSSSVPYPPGPDDAEGWREYLKAYPTLEPAFCRGIDGSADRLDRDRTRRLKALGNAVVPQCAEAVGWMIRELA